MTLFLPYRRPLLGTAFCRNELWKRARAVPSLDLRFAENKSLADAVTGQSLITFTRASSGTYVGSDGLIKTAAVNEPRFDHNPTTGESLGLLVEEQRTNLFPSSIYTANANGWTNGIIGGTGTIASASVTNKAGNTNGVFNVSGLDGNSYVGCFVSTASSTNTYTASVFVKNNGGTFFQLRLVNQTGGTFKSSGTQYTFATGAWQDGVEGTVAPISRSVQDMGDGWFRFSITAADNGTGNTQTSLLLFGGSTTTNYNFYLWGAQLEAGSFPTSYIPTTTAAATRSADVASITGTAFSSWYRQDEGTVFADILRSYSGNFSVYPNIISFNDGTANNLIALYGILSSQNITNFSIQSGGVAQTDFVQLASNFPGPNRISQAVAANSSIFLANGTLTAQDNTVTMPNGINRVSIGSDRVFASQWGGHVRRLTYWPARLPNSTLQAITQ